MTGAPTSVPLYARELFRRIAGETLRPGGLVLTKRAAEVLRLAPGSLVLDVGCGPGASLAYLASLGLLALGVDPAAPDRGRTGPVGAGRVRGRAEALPVASGSAAAVFCECVLSVTESPLAALAEMRRALRPGGHLVVSDLFLRAPRGPGLEGPATGCLSGAVERDELTGRIESAGFTLLRFEDHSRLLAQLAGQLVFSGFDARALGLGCSSGRPGYCLVLAQRRDA